MISLGIAQKVMIGTSLLGTVAGLVGSYGVLRRRALVGDMLAHAALPGICLAFLIGVALQPALQARFGTDLALGRNILVLLAGALTTGLLGMGIVTLVCRWTRTKEDAAIGIVLSTFFGGGIVLLSVIRRLPVPDKSGLATYLFGQATSMLWHDIYVIACVSAVCLLVLCALHKEFKLLSFDPDFARSQGWPTTLLDLVMMGALTIVTVVGLPVVGVVLMAALIILPGAAARFWTERLGRMMVISAAIGAATGVVGTWASAGGGLPAGPIIVVCGATLFLFSVVFAPRRGLLSRLIHTWRLRRKTARENLLRTLYELSEPDLPKRRPIAIGAVRQHRAWSKGVFGWVIRSALHSGLITRTGDQLQLTAAGLARAVQVTRKHRLWELYLIQGAGIAADHVDRDADSIEHLLTPAIVRRLEGQLAEVGRLPGVPDVPQSPHELAAAEVEDAHG